MAAVLEFDGVSKRYRSVFARQERWALRDFSLQIEAGEIVGFLGPNGAGKTTAIHIALGLCSPSKGAGKLLGRNFGEAAARKRIGFLSETPAFYHRKAVDVLKFCGALNGVREPELSRRAHDLLEAVGLASDSNRNIGKFSRGMLQRIGVAQALMNDPDLLILDEPTSALDPVSRLQVRQVLLDARAKGKTVFLSSHQLSEVELVCDRVIFVREGEVIASGKMSELTESASEFEIVAEGLASAPDFAREAHQQNGRWTLIVDKQHQQQAIEKIWAAGGRVVSVTPRTRNLEDLFVKLMNESSSKAGQ
jgi:ABC-2 type transport system ATP-binding protein